MTFKVAQCFSRTKNSFKKVLLSQLRKRTHFIVERAMFCGFWRISVFCKQFALNDEPLTLMANIKKSSAYKYLSLQRLLPIQISRHHHFNFMFPTNDLFLLFMNHTRHRELQSLIYHGNLISGHKF